MTPLEILFATGAAGGAIAFVTIAIRQGAGSWLIAAMLCAGFAGFTAIAVWQEGPIGFIADQSATLWGTQVWYDLVMAVAVALFFVVPRARAMGMQIVPYMALTAFTGSIGLLAMVARLLWLEERAR